MKAAEGRRLLLALALALSITSVPAGIVYATSTQEKLNQAQEDKKQLLHHYLAYQLGTLLQAIAQLSDRNIRKDMMKKVKPLLYLLAETDNQKVKLLYLANKLAGIRGCVALLRLRNRLG